MDKTPHSVSEGDILFDIADSIAYFTVRKSDLAVQVEGRSAKVKGTWNEALFLSMLNDATVCSYDMTEVNDIVARPNVANPNAMIYTSYEIPGASNIVVDGVCDNLIINTAYEFNPSMAFTARKAQLIMANAERGVWHDALIPFAAPVPYGMQVKVPESISTSLRYLTWNYVDNIEANTIFLYLPDKDGLNAIFAENVMVSTDSLLTAFDENMYASTLMRDIDETAMLLGDRAGLSYYLPAESATELKPFTSVLTIYYKNGYRTWRESSEYHNDIYYRKMTENINQAYQEIEQHGAEVSDIVLADFLNALKHTEDFFTYRQANTEEEASAENDALKAAIQQFLQAVADGIDVNVVDVNAQKHTEYYNLRGQRILKPERGMVIMRQGNQVKKIYVK
jgi:hypothetical protein